MKTKKVNIFPSEPIITVNPPIRSAVKNVTKSYKEIRLCILSRATVEEILKDGSTVRLDFTNYNKDNEVKKEVVVNPIPVTPNKPEVKHENKIPAPNPTNTKVEEAKKVEMPKVEEIKNTPSEEVKEEPKTDVVEEKKKEVVSELVKPVATQQQPVKQNVPAKTASVNNNIKK